MTTIDRINQLSSERATLYAQASNGGRAAKAVLGRVHEIDAELASLWALRRQEKATRRDGIDLIVDRAYALVYGGDYENAVSPAPVSEPADERVAVAA
jgi:hypothetical protein